jgi:hypothetical protein
LLTRNNNDIQLKEYYKRYSKILSKVIRTAKILHNNQILHSKNKIKITWNIIKSETGGNNIKYDKVNVLNTDKEYNNNVKAEIFNKYFLSTAEIFQAKLQGVINKLVVVLNTLYLTYLKFLILHLPVLLSTIHLQGKSKKSLIPSHEKTHVGL